MLITQGNIIDIILAVCFLFAVVRGWYEGLALKAAHLAALIAAAVCSHILAKMIGLPVLSGILFIVLIVTLQHLVKVVDVVNWIPVVGTLNRLGGAAAGFIAAFLWCYVIFAFLGAVIPQHTWAQWGVTRQVIANTYILQAFLK